MCIRVVVWACASTRAGIHIQRRVLGALETEGEVTVNISCGRREPNLGPLGEVGAL